MKKVTIVGAGISGLSLAWFLQKSCQDKIHITLIEKSSKVGGWIETHRENEFLCELGPRGFTTKGKGAKTYELCLDLGLESEMIAATSAFKQRLLFTNNKLQSLPTHPIALLTSPLMRPYLGTLWKERRVCFYEKEETIEDFFSRRFSKKFTETFIDPMVSGIFGGEISELSLSACFPSIKKMEQDYGSIVKAILQQKKTKKSSLISFKEGMETLPQTLYQKLKDRVRFLFSTSLERISLEKNVIELFLDQKKSLKTDYLVLATSPSMLPDFFDKPFIPKASIVTVHLGFEKNILKHKGFGYLIPSKEKEKILGATWDSQIFGRSSHTLIGIMLGGSRFPEMAILNDGQLEKIALNATQRHLGIYTSPKFLSIHRAHHAVPQYLLGHNQRLQKLQKEIQSHTDCLFLTGNHYHGIGVNDCVDHAYSLSIQISDKILNNSR